MMKTANVVTRIDPVLKKQAEIVLDQLGISMSTAMEIYLRQIALQRKIPFEMKLPTVQPISLPALTNDEFDALMDKAISAYADSLCVSIDNFESALQKEMNL